MVPEDGKQPERESKARGQGRSRNPRMAARLGGWLALYLIGAWLVLGWAEAEKEIRIFCALFRPGTPEAQVVRTLSTAHWSRWAETGSPRSLVVTSHRTLGASRCDVTLTDGAVRKATLTNPLPLRIGAAWVATVGFASLAVFQLLLALGRPWGHLAWGGGHRILPKRLRLASLASMGILILASAALLDRAGVTRILPWPALAEGISWALVLLFALSLLGNLFSGSRWERRIFAPVAFVLSLACLAVGLGM